MPLLDHFNLIAGLYERFSHGFDPQGLISALDLPVGGRLLDVGGGTGRIARKLGGCAGQLIVSDPARAMLEHARNHPGIEVVESLAECLPFPAGSFSRILMVDAYHHLADQQASLAELWRLLAPGGRLLISEPDIHQWLVRLVAIAEKLLLMRSRFVPAEEIAFSLEQFGAQVAVQITDHTADVLAIKVG